MSATDNGLSLGDRLKAKREALGLSQSQAARELDVARTAYRLWELEAARPAPDRWRLVARWLGVSMTTLLVAEGLVSDAEGEASLAVEDRFEAATGEISNDAADEAEGNFFEQAHAFIDRNIERGLMTATEAAEFRGMFRRIERRIVTSEE